MQIEILSPYPPENHLSNSPRTPIMSRVMESPNHDHEVKSLSLRGSTNLIEELKEIQSTHPSLEILHLPEYTENSNLAAIIFQYLDHLQEIHFAKNID